MAYAAFASSTLRALLELLPELGDALLPELLLRHREDLLPLLLDVVLDELAEDGHLRLERVRGRVDRRQLRQDEVDDVMLLDRLEHHVLHVLRADLAHGGIEDLLLDGRVHLQVRDDLGHEALSRLRLLRLFHLFEELHNLFVLLLEKIRSLHRIGPPMPNTKQ
jgi:hypothetical protein